MASHAAKVACFRRHTRKLMQSMIVICEIIVYFIGFGLLYYIIREFTCENFVKLIGWKGFMFFSFIGTPIHELAHLITALIFGHEIVDFVLFSPVRAKQTGELGHVNHSYNKKSLYQKAGNFFIGVAPMIVGVITIILLLKFMFPEYTNSIIPQSTGAINLTFILEIPKNMFINIGKLMVFNDYRLYLLLFLSINIVLHMSISMADLKNSVIGIVSLIIFSFILIFVSVFIFNPATVISFISFILYYLVFGLIFGLVILLTMMIISTIFVLTKNIVRRISRQRARV